MPNQPKTPLKCFRIPEDTYQAAKRHAETQGTTLSEVVRGMIANYIADVANAPLGHESCQHKAYRLSCAEYDQMLSDAAGKCQRCAKRAKSLEIDHDHRFGYEAVRGLVCGGCNKILGRCDRGESRGLDPVTVRYLAQARYLQAVTK